MQGVEQIEELTKNADSFSDETKMRKVMEQIRKLSEELGSQL